MAVDNTEKETRVATARAVVQRGRTVCVPDMSRMTLVGKTPEGAPVYRAVLVEYGPGNTVELPADEIASLKERGFLVDPRNFVPETADSGV